MISSTFTSTSTTSTSFFTTKNCNNFNRETMHQNWHYQIISYKSLEKCEENFATESKPYKLQI